jgi:uncharacterized protein (TIGR02246 family)
MLSRRTGLLLLALFAAVPQGAFAQTASPADARTIEDVKAVDAAIWEAASACDKDRFATLVADDAALITPYGFVLDKKTLGNSTAGACNFTWKMEPIKVQLYGNTAVVVGAHTYWSKPDKGTVTGRYIYTRIYEKRDSRWLMVFAQHQIVTDTSNHGNMAKDPMTDKDRAVLSGWK